MKKNKKELKTTNDKLLLENQELKTELKKLKEDTKLSRKRFLLPKFIPKW